MNATSTAGMQSMKHANQTVKQVKFELD